MRTANPQFRALLVALLDESGMSQSQAAAKAHIARSYLSQVISGTRSPSPSVAQALDDALAGHGQLTALVPSNEHDDPLAAVTAPHHISTAAVDGLAHVLAGQRTLDDALGSAQLIDAATTQMAAIATMVREVTGPTRPALMSVAAQWAQFLGWLNISTGRWDTARTWLATSQEWAMETSYNDLTATVVSYQAHLAWLTGQVAPAIGLAEAAARCPNVYPGQRAYDLYAAGRGHAQLGDLDTASRLLAQGDEAAAEANTWTTDLPPWQYYRAPWQWAAERGLVLLYMARSARHHAGAAVVELQAGVDGIPEEMAEADWAAEYMTHLATAYLCADAPDMTRAVLDRAAGIARRTGSTRVMQLVEAREQRLRVSKRH